MFARWFGSIATAVLAASGLRFLAAVFAAEGYRVTTLSEVTEVSD